MSQAHKELHQLFSVELDRGSEERSQPGIRETFSHGAPASAPALNHQGYPTSKAGDLVTHHTTLSPPHHSAQGPLSQEGAGERGVSLSQKLSAPRPAHNPGESWEDLDGLFHPT